MTIEYKGGAVIIPRTIKNATFVEETTDWLSGERVKRTLKCEILLLPGDTPSRDKVIFKPEGRQAQCAIEELIKKDPNCKSNGISWSDPSRTSSRRYP